jgi:hypothetical protein
MRMMGASSQMIAATTQFIADSKIMIEICPIYGAARELP